MADAQYKPKRVDLSPEDAAQLSQRIEQSGWPEQDI